MKEISSYLIYVSYMSCILYVWHESKWRRCSYHSCKQATCDFNISFTSTHVDHLRYMSVSEGDVHITLWDSCKQATCDFNDSRVRLSRSTHTYSCVTYSYVWQYTYVFICRITHAYSYMCHVFICVTICHVTPINESCCPYIYKIFTYKIFTSILQARYSLLHLESNLNLPSQS